MKASGIQGFFYESLRKGYTAMVDELRSFLFQGFEWDGDIFSQRVFSLEQVSYTPDELQFPTPPKEDSQRKVEGGFLAAVGGLFCRIRKGRGDRYEITPSIDKHGQQIHSCCSARDFTKSNNIRSY